MAQREARSHGPDDAPTGHPAGGFAWRGMEITTNRDVLEAAVACQTGEDAAEFLAAFTGWLEGRGDPEPEATARVHVRYVAGFSADRYLIERIHGLFVIDVD